MESNNGPKSPDAWSILSSSLKVGAFTGGGGLLLGGAQGILFSNTPTLFAAFSGIQWFTAGSVYWATRSTILNRRRLQSWFQATRGLTPDPDYVDTFSSRERVKASTIAGGVSGGIVAAVTRGRSNVIPGIIIFSLSGYGGQSIYNILDTKHTEQEEIAAQESAKPKGNLLQRLANSRLSPVKVLSDEEYGHMLKEKLLRIETEIALVDENIEALRQKQAQKQDVPNR